MDDFVLANGVSILALVLGLVQFIKSQIPGIQGPKATGLALLVGVLFGVGYKLLPFVDPVYLPWVQAVVEGVAFGMGAAGLYKVAREFQGPAIPEAVQKVAAGVRVNYVGEAGIRPAVITNVLDEAKGIVNLQVFHDSDGVLGDGKPNVYWATSVTYNPTTKAVNTWHYGE